jgi:predicted methyltransferase
MSNVGRNRFSLLAVLCLLLTISLAWAAEVNTSNHIANAIATEGRPETDLTRDTTSKPAEVLEFFGLKPGDVVIDLFGGGGYYTEIAARVVGGEGKVYFHNNKAYIPFVEKELDVRFADHRLDDVVRMVTEADDLGLPEEQADMVLMVMCYHDLYVIDTGWPEIDRELFWKQVFAALKPGGTLAVVDHVAEAGTGSSAAQSLHRIDEDYAKKDIEAAGFLFEAESDALRNPEDDHTLIVFDPEIRRKTDRFVYKFTRPNSEKK